MASVREQITTQGYGRERIKIADGPLAGKYRDVFEDRPVQEFQHYEYGKAHVYKRTKERTLRSGHPIFKLRHVIKPFFEDEGIDLDLGDHDGFRVLFEGGPLHGRKDNHQPYMRPGDSMIHGCPKGESGYRATKYFTKNNRQIYVFDSSVLDMQERQLMDHYTKDLKQHGVTPSKKVPRSFKARRDRRGPKPRDPSTLSL